MHVLCIRIKVLAFLNGCEQVPSMVIQSLIATMHGYQRHSETPTDTFSICHRPFMVRISPIPSTLAPTIELRMTQLPSSTRNTSRTTTSMECPAASRVPASHSGENALSMNVSEIKVVKDPWATERCDFLVSLAEFSCAFRANVGIT